jgi:RND superfamily putative drug exporter
MELLGRANWWFPAWLDRIVPRVSVEVAIEGDEGIAGLMPPTPEPVSVGGT